MMTWQRIIGWIVGIVAAVAMVGGTFIASGGAAVAAAQAAPAAHTAATQAAARITSKITLPETSIDSPALASIIPTAPNQTTMSVLGWTGTDAAHHLNVETSSDGLHFGNKLTLHETSPFRPAVTLLTKTGPVSIAWTGTDANHSLNVLFNVYSSNPAKLTLWNDNSFTAPALLQGESISSGNLLFLAWTGTDANHSLNILPILVSGGKFTLGTKRVLSQFSSNAGPQLSPTGFNPQGGTNSIALNWTSRANRPMAAIAGYPDFDFQSRFVATLPEATVFAPETIFHVEYQNGPTWIGWTGTDAAHHLNVESTTNFPSFPNPKTILGDTAFGGPALAQNDGNQIAWTGTDAAHHLNIAKFA